MPITEGTGTDWTLFGVEHVFVGSVPAMNSRVSMFWGKV